MNREQLEFLISQYVDGTLPAGERGALEQRLKTDGDAQQILAEYRMLNELLRTQLPAAPELDWDRLAKQTSDALHDEDAPVLTYRIFTWGRMAMAASVLLVGAIAFAVYHQGAAPQPRNTPQAIVRVDGPSAEPATQPAIAQVTVGPANDLAEAQYPLDGIVYQPTQVSLIATPDQTGQDNLGSPYQR